MGILVGDGASMAPMDLLREGELAGVWRTRGPDTQTPVAVFDLSSSLAWLLAGRVRQIYPREGWGRIEAAEVVVEAPARPAPDSATPLAPGDRGGDWRFASPTGGFRRDPEGRESWAVGLLDLATCPTIRNVLRLSPGVVPVFSPV